MTVVGLDLSLRGTGLCALSATGHVTARVGYELDKQASAKDDLERKIYLAKQVVTWVEQHKPVAVAVEGYAFNRFAKSQSVTDLAELGGLVKSQLWLKFGIVTVTVPVSAARKVVLGKGYRQKEEVRSALEAKGLAFPSNDEQDAYVVARWLWSKIEKETKR